MLFRCRLILQKDVIRYQNNATRFGGVNISYDEISLSQVDNDSHGSSLLKVSSTSSCVKQQNDSSL
jgi:hypothetical protein